MSRRYFRYQMTRDRASRNMRAIRGMGSRELYLRGIGQGIIFLVIGLIILGLNMQNAGRATFIADVQALPAWAWVFGGGIGSFGLYWAIKNAGQLFAVVKPARNEGDGARVPDKASPRT